MGGPNSTHPGRVVEYDQPPSPRTPSRRSSAAARKELGHLNFEPVPVISKAQIIAPAGRRRLTKQQPQFTVVRASRGGADILEREHGRRPDD